MTVYILRYASDGETSHINEAFTNKEDARKRYNQLKKEAIEYEEIRIDEPAVERFDWPFENYVKKVTVNNTKDLIKLINAL